MNIGHQPRLIAVRGPLSPVVEELYNKPPEAFKSIVSDFTCYNGPGQGCVAYLRSRGYCVPQNPRGAGSLPVKSTQLPPIGEVVYIISYETPLGHVSRGFYDGENLITTVDSAGEGRIIPLSLYKGWY